MSESLLDQTTDLRCLATSQMADYANVRANTLRLNVLERVLFRDAAIRNFWAGAGSVENALRAAAEEIQA